MSGVPRLHLDFESRPTASAAGHVLAVAGAAAIAAALLANAALSREIADGEVEAPLAGPVFALPPGVASEQEAIGGARAVAAHLSGPWDKVLRSLESIAEPDVALLALDPDVEARRVRIRAEARNLDAMLAYYRGLRGTGAFEDVFVAEHLVRDDDPQKPVRFSMVATWGRP